jgi:hypothetical protein
MSGFSAAWLDLREGFDRAARSDALMRRFASLLAPAPRIVDLGAGSGSNVRALAPLVPARTRWRLVDDDEALLALAATRCGEVACERRDLVHDLEAAIGDADGVAAAALADLVSSDWLDRLFAIAARRAAPVLMTLTTDGTPVLEPAAPGDAAVIAGFTLDQARDKGFGPALGANAPGALIAAATRHGYGIEAAHSDWQIGTDDAAMLGAMLDYLAGGAIAAQPESHDAVKAWHAARRADVAARRLRMRVGHRDILAYPIRS